MSTKKAVNLVFAVLVLAMIGSLGACSGGPSEEEKQQAYISRFDSTQQERKDEFDAWYEKRQLSEGERGVEFRKLYALLSSERRAEAADVFEEGFDTLYDPLSEDRDADATALFNDLYEARKALEPTPEERKAELRKLYDSLSGAHQEAEVLEIIESVIFDGKHEIPSLVLKLSGVDVEKEVVDPYRQVFTEIGFNVTAEEALRIYNASSALEGYEPVEELPPWVSISEEGRVYVPGEVVGVFFPIMIGQLSIDEVMIPDLTYVGTCYKFEGDPFTLVRFTIAPTADEGAWKEEVLFDGTAQELCSNGESSPVHDPGKEVVVFKRPNIKVFPVPDGGPIRVASADDLRSGGLLVFPKSTPSGSLELGFGLLDSVRRVGSSSLVTLEFSPIANTLSGSAIDEGAPLYYVTGEKDDPLVLVGYIHAHPSEMFARSAELYLEGIEGFSYVMWNPDE